MMTPGRTIRHGFTTVELLVVIVIVCLVMAILFPALGSLRRSTRISSGANAIQSAVIATRAFAVQDREGKFIEIWNIEKGEYEPCDQQRNCGNSGAAVIFTPSGEMRIAANAPDSQGEKIDGSEFVLELAGISDYTDIPKRDYIRMPTNIGVMGIRRDENGIVLLSPPFAMRFDTAGRLVVSNADAEVVYYDGNCDNFVQGTRNRYHAYDPSYPLDKSDTAIYDPVKWDPYQGEASDLAKHPLKDRWPLPFERLETVIGVVVYDKVEAPDEISGKNTLAEDEPAEKFLMDWLMDYGNPLFFSRYSGTLISEREGSR